MQRLQNHVVGSDGHEISSINMQGIADKAPAHVSHSLEEAAMSPKFSACSAQHALMGDQQLTIAAVI
jgi:hypothetical protein